MTKKTILEAAAAIILFREEREADFQLYDLIEAGHLEEAIPLLKEALIDYTTILELAEESVLCLEN